MAKKIVIIGGVAGGASTAARLRRLNEQAKIIIFEKDGYISFANCGLPYYVGGAIPERDALLLQTPDSFYARFRVDVRTHSEVTSVDTARKLVHISSAEHGEYEEAYDTLVVCPGANPIALPAEQAAQPYVFTLRNIEDVDRIFARVTQGSGRRAVVIGAGFIGLEMAESLVARGFSVQLVEAAPHILPPFDAEIAGVAQRELARHGVSLFLGVGVDTIVKSEGGIRVLLQDGQALEVDMAICAVGVRPATAFLQGSGIALGPKGHILVDEHMRTNLPDIYAAGDAVQIMDFTLQRPTAVPLAGPANRQARLAADAIAGMDHAYGGAQGSAIIKLFGLTAACTGVNERTLLHERLPYHKVVTHPYSHATYYPGAQQMTAQLLFSPEGKIYGLQMIGAEGVDKRVDVVATAMRLGAHVETLAELELCYAPPYSSAKDPVNMLGYVAQNVLSGVTAFVDASALGNLDLSKTILLDVRTPGEFTRGHLPGAINIPVDELRERMHELDRTKEIIEYCQVGARAHTAYRILVQNGFSVKSVAGGFQSCAR